MNSPCRGCAAGGAFDGQRHAGSRRAAQHLGGLVGRHVFAARPVDRDDVFARVQAPLFGRAVGQNVDEEHALAGIALHFNSQPHKLAVDVAVQVGQPVGREKVAVVVEAIAAAEDVLEDHRGGRQVQLPFNQIGDFGDGVASDREILDGAIPESLPQHLPHVSHASVVDLSQVVREELLVGQRVIQALGSVSDERSGAHFFHIIHADVFHDLVEEREGRLARQLQQPALETAVFIAALDRKLDLRATQAVLDLGIVGKVFESVLVGVDGVEPASRALMFQPDLDRGGRIGGRLIDAGHAPGFHRSRGKDECKTDNQQGNQRDAGATS